MTNAGSPPRSHFPNQLYGLVYNSDGTVDLVSSTGQIGVHIAVNGSASFPSGGGGGDGFGQPPVPFIQDSDPGEVGAGSLWVDTSADLPVLNIRNSADDGWDPAGGDVPFVGSSAPSDPLDGELWWDPDDDTALGATGPAGGDLSGEYPDPVVAAVGGVVVTGTPTTGQVPVASSSSEAVWSTLPPAPVGSVFGRAGDVLPQTGDYTPSQVGALAATASAGGDLGGSFPNPTVTAAGDVSGRIGSLVIGAKKVLAAMFGSASATAGQPLLADGSGGAAYGTLAASQVTHAADLSSASAQVFTGPVAASAAVLAGELPRLSQVSPLFTIASGALPTVQCVTGTGRQVSLTRDVDTYTPVTYNSLISTSATLKIELSPDGSTYSILGTVSKPVGVAFAGEVGVEHVRVPAGWFIRLTATQAVLGVTTYA